MLFYRKKKVGTKAVSNREQSQIDLIVSVLVTVGITIEFDEIDSRSDRQ